MTKHWTRPYLARHSMEVLDAHEIPGACPECGNDMARITYAITRRLRTWRGKRADAVSTVNTVIACQDTQFCNYFENVDLPSTDVLDDE